jgi:peroxiredoxin
MNVKSTVIGLACVSAMVCSAPACAPTANRAVAVENPLAEGAVSLPEGGELRLEERRGHVVVLAFFTSWCPSSGPALRAVEELRAHKAASGLDVIAVGEGESADEVRAFATKHGVRANVVFDKGGALATRLALATVPAVVVIARDGTIRLVQAGYHGDDDRTVIARAVEVLLEAERSDGSPISVADWPHELR